MTYPTQDNHRGVDTSIDAAAMAALTSSELRQIVLKTLCQHPENLTVDQVCAIAERPRYSLQPRFTELRKMGMIRDTGERRQNVSGASAIVWRAVFLDRQEAQA
ncbi:hypothetical protein [uncultured Sphingomonas sp.]|uniref:hypothetical protein n=1 Tax=uncultured Sphingomonas sp. TaxID=158754 RepID=UPI0025D6560F|nr:hypothetical protein [uncultured Sphingomonas sp.]